MLLSVILTMVKITQIIPQIVLGIILLSLFLITPKIIYNLYLSIWFYLFVEQPVMFCFPFHFYACQSHFYGLLVWLYAVFLFAKWQNTQKNLGANTMHNDFIKDNRFGRNIIAKQSQTLMGFAQNTTFKVHFI